MENYHSQAELRVRYQETDQMGVVYHANYLVWFEVGRTTLLRELGYSYPQLEKEGILLPVVAVECQYRHPARYDYEILVQTRLKEVAASKIVFQYEVLRKSDLKSLAVGQTVHLSVSKDEMKRISLKQRVPDLYQRLVELFQLEEV